MIERSDQTGEFQVLDIEASRPSPAAIATRRRLAEVISLKPRALRELQSTARKDFDRPAGVGRSRDITA